ncbi:MAG: hypothetical protein AABX96_04480 [Nanoarchaeota archaeon]
MKIEYHKDRLKESLKVIGESIEKGLLERQRNIGFNTSAASADMLEIFLHKKSLIDSGFIVKHEWLKSKNSINEKFPFDFTKKNEIFEIILKIEEKRNVLCYGTNQKEESIRQVIENFNKLKSIFKEAGLDEFE